MKPALLIRAALESDIPTMATLLDTLNQIEGCGIVTEERTLKAALFRSAGEVKLTALVAQLEGQVAGVLLCYPGYDTVSASYGYHLADMVVASAHQRQGIGKALVKALAVRALAEKKEWVSLTALTRNDAAQQFYQSLGMAQVDVTFFAIGKAALIQL